MPAPGGAHEVERHDPARAEPPAVALREAVVLLEHGAGDARQAVLVAGVIVPWLVSVRVSVTVRVVVLVIMIVLS